MSEAYALAAGFVFGIATCGLFLYYWLIRPMARLLGSERDEAKRAWWDQRNEWAVATGKNIDVMAAQEAEIARLTDILYMAGTERMLARAEAAEADLKALMISFGKVRAERDEARARNVALETQQITDALGLRDTALEAAEARVTELGSQLDVAASLVDDAVARFEAAEAERDEVRRNFSTQTAHMFAAMSLEVDARRAAEAERDALIAAAKVIEIKGLSPESAQLYFDQRNEQADLRMAAAVRVTELEAALRAIQSWDMLNPPDASKVEDFPWLKRLVDAALAKEEA